MGIFHRLGVFCARHRWLVIGVWLGLNVPTVEVANMAGGMVRWHELRLESE